MKKIKIIALLITLGGTLFLLGGCGKQVHIEGKLDDLMKKLYEGIAEDQKPMMLTTTKLTKENQVGYIGEADIKYEEAVASESMTGSIAHSIVLIRMKEDASEKELDEAVKQLEEKIDPRKWICVGVEKVHVERKGDLIVAVLDDETGDTILNNFKNLK